MNNEVLEWVPVWHQAITPMCFAGKPFKKDVTLCFRTKAYISGEQIRLRFQNTFGKTDYLFGAVTISLHGEIYDVTVGGAKSFSVPMGKSLYSDRIICDVKELDELEIRLYYLNYIIDFNMTEEYATMMDGDTTHQLGTAPMKKPPFLKLTNSYNAVVSLDSVEVLSENAAKMIIAFGDSITAMNRWCKPLSERLYKEFGSEYQLLNAGISGNCLLYEKGGIIGKTLGRKGIDRFDVDAMSIEHLHSVIIGLGVNDVSYYNEKTKETINFEQYKRAITELTEKSHAHNVRVTMQTITPRLGCSFLVGKFTDQMEQLRLQINDWIRTCNLFDYVFDADEVVREKYKDGFRFAKHYQQGDFLHPNALGGKVLADAYDLAKLTGEQKRG